MSTKRKTYQIFTLFNKEISKNLPKYQAWSNGASRGNGAIEKKGAQVCTSNLCSTALVSNTRGHVRHVVFITDKDHVVFICGLRSEKKNSIQTRRRLFNMANESAYV